VVIIEVNKAFERSLQRSGGIEALNALVFHLPAYGPEPFTVGCRRKRSRGDCCPIERYGAICPQQKTVACEAS